MQCNLGFELASGEMPNIGDTGCCLAVEPTPQISFKAPSRGYRNGIENRPGALPTVNQSGR